MTNKVYAAEAVLLVLVGFGSSIFGEGSPIPVLLFAVMCGLIVWLMVASYNGRTAPDVALAQLSGPVTDVVSSAQRTFIVPGDMFMGTTEGRTDFKIGGQPIFIRRYVNLGPGDVVTVAGIPGATFEAVAMRDRNGINALPAPRFPFDDPKREMAINGFLTVFLYGFVVCTIIKRRFDKMWSWRNAIERSVTLLQSAPAPAASAAAGYTPGQPAGPGVSAW